MYDGEYLAKIKRDALKSVNIEQIPEFIVADVVTHLAKLGIIVQHGCVAVPIKPTEAMQDAARGRDTTQEDNLYEGIYKAMIAATQKID